METEFGRIARLTERVADQATPLQRKLAYLGEQLGIFSVAISLLVVAAGWRQMGEPTEAALIVAARKAGLHPPKMRDTVRELSFDSSRKRMTVVERCCRNSVGDRGKNRLARR